MTCGWARRWTFAELAALTADLPGGLIGARPLRKPARAQAHPPVNKVVTAGACVIMAVAALGLLAGSAFAMLTPPMLSSEAAVDVVLSLSAQAAAPQGGPGGINPALATQIVIAGSDPVLESALRTVDPSMSLQTLQSRVRITNAASTDILSISAEGETAAQAGRTANAVADSYVADVGSVSSGGRVPAHVLDRAVSATETPPPSRLLVPDGLGALLGALIGAIGALAFSRSDRR